MSSAAPPSTARCERQALANPHRPSLLRLRGPNSCARPEAGPLGPISDPACWTARRVRAAHDVEAIEATGRPDVEGVLADLPDGADARQRQEKSEVVREILEIAGDGLAAGQVFGLEVRAVHGENELRLGRGGAGLHGFEGVRDLAAPAGGNVDDVRLQDAAKVRLVCRAAPRGRSWPVQFPQRSLCALIGVVLVCYPAEGAAGPAYAGRMGRVNRK